MIREVFEEIRAKASNPKFLMHMLDEDGCYLYKHWTHVYSCEIDRDPILNIESKTFGWFTPDKIANLRLTKVTRKILETLLMI